MMFGLRLYTIEFSQNRYRFTLKRPAEDDINNLHRLNAFRAGQLIVSFSMVCLDRPLLREELLQCCVHFYFLSRSIAHFPWPRPYYAELRRSCELATLHVLVCFR